MARLAARRTRSPASNDDEDDDSRAGTPLSTAPNDRKRARLSTRNRSTSGSSVSSDDDDEIPPVRRRTIQSKLPSSSIATSNNRYAAHQPGAIVRVKLTNFVTYTRAEFFPGPSLNMVIGPNGTGKSTLVCAICLGLGWGTQWLGRGKDIGEFVKHGASQAEIEIELKGDPNKSRHNPVITRTITKDGNKSTWKRNSQHANEKICRTLAQSYNIQIDNLCQFLPQDKVVEFAQMNPKEVLNSTQRAAGTERMVACHAKLIECRESQKDILGRQHTDQEELDNLKKRQEAQSTEVQRMRDRETYQQKLEWLKKTKILVQFLEAKKATKEAKDKQKRLETELFALEEEVAPTFRKVTAKQKYQQRLATLKARRERDRKSAADKCDEAEQEIRDLTGTLEDLRSNIDSDKNAVQKKKQELQKLRTALRNLEYEQDKGPPKIDARTMTQEITDLNREITDMDENRISAEDRQAGLRGQVERRNNQVKEKEKELQAFDTLAGQRDSRLKSVSADTLKAWRWIEDNQGRFEKPVFGPPAVVCKLSDPNMAAAVESILQKSDFKVITTQTENDYTMLQNQLVKVMGLHDLSLRLRFDDDLSQYQKPFSADEMRSLGLDSYIIDHIEGPKMVLAMLCSERKLHLSAIANRRISAEQHEKLVKSKLAAYVADGQYHRFIRREDIGPDASSTQSSLTTRPMVFVDQPVDLGRKSDLQRELAELKGEINESNEGLTACATEIREILGKVKGLRDEVAAKRQHKKELQDALSAFNTLGPKINEHKRKIKGAEEFCEGARARRDELIAKREDAMITRAEAAVEHANAVRSLRDAMTALIETEVMLIEATSDYEVMAQRNQDIKDLLDSKRKEEKEARKASEDLLMASRPMIEQCKKISKEAKSLSEAGQPELLALCEDIYNEAWTVAHHAGEMEATTAQIALTEGGNADAIRQYEDRVRKIETLTTRLASTAEDLTNARLAIKEIRDEWEPQLETLVAKISDAFGESFARIGCAGQVEVGRAHSTAAVDCTEENGGEENGLEFADWSINISVKFRENEPLSLLDSHRQSGGERAVSTIFYLMALQSLSRAPFRVVDEINQGMDPRNERMVHGRMVDVATSARTDGGQGSQYFLITPKLLDNLVYKRGMTVLCIVSGENVPGEGDHVVEGADVPWKKYPRMDLGGFVGKGRELGVRRWGGMGGVGGMGGGIGGLPGAGRRVDSGVAMVGA